MSTAICSSSLSGKQAFGSFFGPAYIPKRVVREISRPNPVEEIPAKKKAELIRYLRDYSMLLSDDPVPSPKPAKPSEPPKEANASHPPVPRKQSAPHAKRRLIRAREEEEEEDEPRPRKRAAVVQRRDDELEKAKISMMIREIFRYNPDKYGDDDFDDRSMVAGFNDIQKEEARSTRIGRKMDAEEERRERLKKKRKSASKRSFIL